MVNRFTTLGSTISPRRTFQFALVSHYDPFEDIEPQKPFNRFPKTSPYYAKLSSHNLFIVESDFSHLKSPEAIVKAYFPPLWYFPAIHLEKSIKFYRDVLLETESIQINPIKCQREQTKVIFHSLFIMKFISQREWGVPHIIKRPKKDSRIQFCYHDYIEAWYRVLLHQNDTHTCSWFINLTRTLKEKFLYGFTSGGKFMVPLMRSSLRKFKKL
jgi:hypothetical protein